MGESLGREHAIAPIAYVLSEMVHLDYLLFTHFVKYSF